MPGTAAPDVVGAFRFTCFAGQLLRDDPIVFPNQPGKSHLHQFYGNLEANASSTYSSLRKSGKSTCMSQLNRSAYWMPAMLDGKGNVVRPDHVQIYYKRRPKSDPQCKSVGGVEKGEGICTDLPNGLKFIFGYDMVTMKPPTGSLYYQCVGTGADASHSPNLAVAAGKCVAGGRVAAVVAAPPCWDGKNLDSPNHRDHVAYRSYGSWGYARCPSTHPYRIPTFTLLASYSIVSGDNIAAWRFSSDEMHPDLPHGTTYHADFFMAWDPVAKQMWHDNCINKLLSCSDGALGNGWKLKRSSDFVYKATPRLVRAT